MDPKTELIIEYYFRNYYDELVVYAYRYLRDWPRANEAAQDAFHTAVRRIDVFSKSKNKVGWLIKTTKNICNNMEKGRRIASKYLVALEDLPISELPSTSDIPLSIETLFGDVATEEEYYLLRRITLEKATYMEVASELNISVWNCQKRMQRLLRKLKKYIEL